LDHCVHRPNPDTLILEDINECNELSKMCENGRCSNTFGSYMCNCNEGFKLDEKSVRCIDVDECASDSFICGVGQCVNLDGKKYRISEWAGFQVWKFLHPQG
jgi:fibulin 1/2